eukprot:CAMPEP_0201254060 /NCGR_PEP_ID=MMETSP0852-20130820/67773_1 /ASSEMBLY_ACC=CAM_ASM_000632 /TAXON_ID=183588 /ORGANISM="Pseudo-nitzschia fraudulenta, Strain WWA7" /LENGTH=112 /DNA_ID=CAMNT_0047553867 /DNA_START=691 /DNA_END=1025 /DNA_ORIENTATION=+
MDYRESIYSTINQTNKRGGRDGKFEGIGTAGLELNRRGKRKPRERFEEAEATGQTKNGNGRGTNRIKSDQPIEEGLRSSTTTMAYRTGNGRNIESIECKNQPLGICIATAKP